MAPPTRSRTADRLVGAVLGALGVLVLLVVAAVVAFLALSGRADGPASEAPLPAPVPAPPAAAPPPADLAADETWLGDVTLDAGQLVTAESDLRDVQAVGSDVRTGPGGTRVGSLAVDATVPFAVVAEQLGPGTTLEPADDGEATVRRRVLVLGREVEVAATGTVEAVGGRLVVEPRTIDVGGTTFLSEALGTAARELVVIEQEVEGLPEGLVLREVTVTDGGFRARLDGRDVLVAP